MRKIALGVFTSLALASTAYPAGAAEELRLGFLAVQSGPLAILGKELSNGMELALEHLGGTVGGRPIKVFRADTKFNPGEAVQQANKLIDRDKVQIVTGLVGSHTMMASVKPLLAGGVIIVGANAGPSPLAGKRCNRNLFVVSFQNDQWSQGIGRYMKSVGVRRGYFMGMDYRAGWDHTKAAIRSYGGKVVAEVYTPVKQLDFSAELTQLRAAKPDGVYAFYVGGAAIAFLKQYAQAGLNRTTPLYSSVAMSDPTLFKAQGNAAVGLITGTHWSPMLDNPQNKRFVAAYRSKYGRNPTQFAANQYDAIMLIDGAVRMAGGFKDKAKLRAALRKAPFKSVRGKFRFNSNQFPIQNIYMQKVAKKKDGKLYQQLIGLAAKDVKDPYYSKCAMSQ